MSYSIERSNRYSMVVDPYAGMTPVEIEKSKRSHETPEGTRKRHKREEEEARFAGGEYARQRNLDRIRSGRRYSVGGLL